MGEPLIPGNGPRTGSDDKCEPRGGLGVVGNAIAEALGAAILVWIPATVAAQGGSLGEIVAAFGLTLAFLHILLKDISGGFLNPVLTIVAVLPRVKKYTKKHFGDNTNWLTVILYIVAQYAGAFIGLWIAEIFYASAHFPGFDVVPQAGRTDFEAAAAEFVATAWFVWFVVLVIIWHDPKTKMSRAGPIGSAYLGVALAIGIWSIAGVSGGSLNPALGLARNFFAGSLSVYYLWATIGQLLGGGLGYVLALILGSTNRNAKKNGKSATN